MFYIAHYGVGHLHGGHSGRYPWGSGKSKNREEAIEILKEKTYNKNIEKWGKNEDTNILYLSGYSGSGKTTLAESLKDDRTEVIFLDSVYMGEYMDEILPQDFKDFFDKNMPDWNNRLKQYKDFDKFETLLEKYGKYKYKKGEKVICEGVQIYDYTLRQDYKNKPIALMKAGPIKSYLQKIKRDEYNIIPYIIDFPEEVKEAIKYVKLMERFKINIGVS